MHFSTILGALALATSALASPIQSLGAGDGIYTVETNADGTTKVNYGGNPGVSSRSVSPLEQRGSYKGVGCDSIGLVPYNTDIAVSSLKTYCANNHCDRTVFFKSGNTVAFFCLWRSGAKFDAGSFDHALEMVTDQCAAYQAGSYSDGSESDRKYSYGYTDWTQHDYCSIPANS